MKAVKLLSDFVISDLSNWFIRRSRRRFFGSEMTEDKKAALCVTYEVLLGVSKLLAPIAPFLSDEIYQNLTGKESSVHLETYPEARENMIDESLTKSMDIARTICNLGRAVREKERIKVRQPLSKIIIPFEVKNKTADFEWIIKEELNIKEIVYEKDKSIYMNFEFLPNFKEAGKVLGKNIGEFKKILGEAKAEDILGKDEITLEIAGEKMTIPSSFIDQRISSKEGFSAEMEEDIFVIMDITVSEELKEEGLVREFFSKVQQLRKSENFDITDRIETRFFCEEGLKDILMKNEETIKQETLTNNFVYINDDEPEFDINGNTVKIKLVK
jgi:isoleucyl-tRNA synthetase